MTAYEENGHIACCVLVFVSVGQAQQPAPADEQRSFTNLSVEDGLSQSSVISIAQDSAGFMWFGTRSCLNRYDSRAAWTEWQTGTAGNQTTIHLQVRRSTNKGQTWHLVGLPAIKNAKAPGLATVEAVNLIPFSPLSVTIPIS